MATKLLTVKELSKQTGLAEWRIYEILKEPDGPKVHRNGRAIRIPEDEWNLWKLRSRTRAGR